MKIVKDGEGETPPAPDRNESLKAQIGLLRQALQTRLWMNITGFRYVLAMLLVVTKLGIFAYIQPNPLVDVSWFYVLLPAFVFELAIGAFVALVLALAIVLGFVASFFYGGYYLIKLMYLKFVYRRKTQHVD